MRQLTVLLASLLLFTTLSAQDYTHTSEQFPDMSASFTALQKTFTLKLGKKELMLMLPNSYQMPDMLAFVNKADQSLDGPMTAKHLLFAIDAIQNWQMKEPLLANEKVITEYTQEKGFQKHESGVYYKVEKQGDGAKLEAGQTVTVHYKGYLPDGTKFDSSFDRNQPFSFQLGQGRVIQGWDRGIPIFNVGGKGTLLVPSEMGYGTRGAGAKIPPNAVLLFDIEVISVE